MILSASQVESFDPDLGNPFACKTRWWLEHPGGHESGKDWSKDKGTAVHETLERFLKGEPQGCLHETVIGAPGALEFLIPLRKRIRFVEAAFKPGTPHPPQIPWLPPVRIGGIDFSGRIDWLAADAVEPQLFDLGDHKTTSNIAKYAKTVGQLKKSPQMNIYARWLMQIEPWAEIRLSQDFYQSKGTKKFELVTTKLLQRENAERILSIEATVEEMVKTSAVTAPEKVAPNLKACRVGYGCPHRAHCPHVKEFSMASLLDMFTAAPAISQPAVTERAPVVPRVAVPTVATGVLPVDAPPSNPPSPASNGQAASSPPLPPQAGVSGASAWEKGEPAPAVQVASETPKRGRKPGSKNKPKDFASPEEIAQMQSVVVVPTIPSLGPVTVRSISIRHDVKIGLPNYSSAGIAIEYGGTITEGASAEEARQSLSLLVRNAAVKELEVYQPKKEEPK